MEKPEISFVREAYVFPAFMKKKISPKFFMIDSIKGQNKQ